jgi:hypothetical protein
MVASQHGHLISINSFPLAIPAMLAQPAGESNGGSTLLDCGKIQAARYGFKAPVEDLRPRALHLQTEAEI